MRLIYRNPKELATAIIDLVELYQDDLITEDKYEEKLKKIFEANEERIFKNGKIDSKLCKIIGDDRIEMIKKVISKEAV